MFDTQHQPRLDEIAIGVRDFLQPLTMQGTLRRSLALQDNRRAELNAVAYKHSAGVGDVSAWCRALGDVWHERSHLWPDAEAFELCVHTLDMRLKIAAASGHWMGDDAAKINMHLRDKMDRLRRHGVLSEADIFGGLAVEVRAHHPNLQPVIADYQARWAAEQVTVLGEKAGKRRVEEMRAQFDRAWLTALRDGL